MKVEIKLQASIDQIAAQAHRIADEVQRLRYLRKLVRRVPQTGRWNLRSPQTAIVAIAAAAAITGAATLIWRSIYPL